MIIPERSSVISAAIFIETGHYYLFCPMSKGLTCRMKGLCLMKDLLERQTCQKYKNWSCKLGSRPLLYENFICIKVKGISSSAVLFSERWFGWLKWNLSPGVLQTCLCAWEMGGCSDSWQRQRYFISLSSGWIPMIKTSVVIHNSRWWQYNLAVQICLLKQHPQFLFLHLL